MSVTRGSTSAEFYDDGYGPSARAARMEIEIEKPRGRFLISCDDPDVARYLEECESAEQEIRELYKKWKQKRK